MKNPFCKTTTFLHTGHIGDIIAFLPIYFGMNGDRLIVCDDPGMDPMSGFKYNSLKPLLESQNINVSFNDVSIVDFDMTHWRNCYENNISLMDSQARFIGFVPRRNGHVKITQPWINVSKDNNILGKVVFNRSHRYRNPNFPWKEIYKKYKTTAVFIGTEEEHEDFCNVIGEIDHYPTKDCLKVAEAINACSLFVGNQSSSCWIAMALMKPLIQEVCPSIPNSIIKYKGAIFGFDNKITIPNII
jgi:hypothetical protein